jgi:hypothetical protein
LAPDKRWNRWHHLLHWTLVTLMLFWSSSRFMQFNGRHYTWQFARDAMYVSTWSTWY